MAEANAIVGRFDGTITYTDQTWGSFHCQIESHDLTNDLVWSMAETLSADGLQRIYSDADNKAEVVAMFEALPFISSFTWTDTGKTDKTVSDKVLHLYLVVAFDNGTSYPVSITHEKGEVRFHSSSASAAGDIPDAKIKAMLEKIMASVTIA